MSLYKEAQKFSDLMNSEDELNVEIDESDLSSFIADEQAADEFEETLAEISEDDDSDTEEELEEDSEDIEISDEGPVAEDEEPIVVQMDEESPIVEQISFKLPAVPGADNAEDIVVEEKREEKSDDPWDWKSSGGLKAFPTWLHSMLTHKIPRHNGVSTAGIERTLSFLENLNRVISNAVRADLNNELDIDVVQNARDEIVDGVKRLKERLSKLESSMQKKNFSQEEGLVKEAQKIGGVKGVMITVPLLISRIARVCINGSITGGKDIEKVFAHQVKEYDLTKREQAEVLQLLDDMGYTVRRDRGIAPDQDIDISSSDNPEWAANYHA
jgi:hypothetical protein